MRFMYDSHDMETKYKSISSGIIIFGISILFFTVILIVINRYFFIDYLFWLWLYGVLMNIQNLYAYIARGLGENALFSIAGVANTLVTAGASLIFLIFMKYNYSSLYISGIIGFFVQVLILSYRVKIIKKELFFTVDWKQVKQMLLYALPLSVNSIAFWFMTSYNKIVISEKLSIFENGLYAISGKFAIAITLVTTCFTLAWQEISFSQGTMDEKNGKFYSAACNLYLKFLIFGTCLLIHAIYFIFPLMIDKEYSQSILYIPVFLLGTIGSAFSLFLGSIFGALKRTGYIFTSTLVGSISNIIVISVLIGRIGIQGANIALSVGFIVTIIFRLVVLNRLINLKIEIGSLVLHMIILSVVTLIYFSSSDPLNYISLFVLFPLGYVTFRREYLRYKLNKSEAI